MDPMKKNIAAVLFIALLSAHGFGQAPDPSQLKKFTPQVAQPIFPKNIVSIAECGGKGDGVTVNTNAFAEAMMKLSEITFSNVRVNNTSGEPLKTVRVKNSTLELKR